MNVGITTNTTKLGYKLKEVVAEMFSDLTIASVEVNLINPDSSLIEFENGLTFRGPFKTFNGMCRGVTRSVVKSVFQKYQQKHNTSNFYESRLNMFEKLLERHTKLITSLKDQFERIRPIYLHRLFEAYKIELF